MTNDGFDSKLDRLLTLLRTDLAILKWMTALAVAAVMSLVIKAFF